MPHKRKTGSQRRAERNARLRVLQVGQEARCKGMIPVLNRELLEDIKSGKYENDVLRIRDLNDSKIIVYVESKLNEYNFGHDRLSASEIRLLIEALTKGKSNIVRLDLATSDMGDDELELLSQLRLEFLDISSTLITDKGISCLLKMPIKRLYLGNNNSITSLDALCEHPTLLELYAESCNRLKFAYKLISFNKFIALDISACNITDEHLIMLPKNNTLKELYCGHNNITDNGVEYIAQNSSINVLGIRNNKITRRGVELLCQMHSLKKLDISDNKIGEIGIKLLSRHPTLRSLEMTRCGGLDNLEVVEELSKNKTLTELEMAQNGISNAGVKLIIRMEQLKKLLIPGNRISKSGITLLEKSSINNVNISSMDLLEENKFTRFLMCFKNKHRVIEVDKKIGTEETDIAGLFDYGPPHKL